MEVGGESETVYDNFDVSNDNAEIKRLQDSLKQSLSKKESLQQSIDELTDHLQAIVEEKDVIENNLISLYNTAIAELARKEKEIEELRKR